MITVADCLEIWPENEALARAVAGMLDEKWRGAYLYIPLQRDKGNYSARRGANTRLLDDIVAVARGRAADPEAALSAFLAVYGAKHILI